MKELRAGILFKTDEVINSYHKNVHRQVSCRQRFQSLPHKPPTGFPLSMCINYCWIGGKRDFEYLHVGDVSCHSCSLLEPLFPFGQSHPWVWSMASANFNPSPTPAWMFDWEFLVRFLFSFSLMLLSIPTNLFCQLICFHHLMSLDLILSPYSLSHLDDMSNFVLTLPVYTLHRYSCTWCHPSIGYSIYSITASILHTAVMCWIVSGTTLLLGTCVMWYICLKSVFGNTATIKKHLFWQVWLLLKA